MDAVDISLVSLVAREGVRALEVAADRTTGSSKVLVAIKE